MVIPQFNGKSQGCFALEIAVELSIVQARNFPPVGCHRRLLRRGALLNGLQKHCRYLKIETSEVVVECLHHVVLGCTYTKKSLQKLVVSGQNMSAIL